jgi:hypothetical protein
MLLAYAETKVRAFDFCSLLLGRRMKIVTRGAFRTPSAEPLIREYPQMAAIIDPQRETAGVGLQRFGRTRAARNWGRHARSLRRP